MFNIKVGRLSTDTYTDLRWDIGAIRVRNICSSSICNGTLLRLVDPRTNGVIVYDSHPTQPSSCTYDGVWCMSNR